MSKTLKAKLQASESVSPWWKVTVTANGVKSAVRVDSPGDSDRRFYYIQAQDKATACAEGAFRYNQYALKKVQERRARLRAENKCKCGRDREPDTKSCAVCKARMSAYNKTRSVASKKELEERHSAGDPRVIKMSHGAFRDDSIRIGANRARVRDRKSEMRLEVFIEVKKKWDCKNVSYKSFEQWLEDEILKMVNSNRKVA